MARIERQAIQLPKKDLSLTVSSLSSGKRVRADATDLSVCNKCSEPTPTCPPRTVSKKNTENKMTVIAGKPVRAGAPIEVVSLVQRRRSSGKN